MSFPLGTGLDYDYGDSVKALCASTDWIDKPTDIPSKITELQDFLLLYLDFDFFYPWNRFYPWGRRKRILSVR